MQFGFLSLTTVSVIVSVVQIFDGYHHREFNIFFYGVYSKKPLIKRKDRLLLDELS